MSDSKGSHYFPRSREVVRYLRYSVWYRLTTSVARWDVLTTAPLEDPTTPDNPLRFLSKASATATALAFMECGHESTVTRRGPGVGRHFRYFYPPSEWRSIDAATSLRDLASRVRR